MPCPSVFTSAATYRVTKRLPSERLTRLTPIVARGLGKGAADSLARALRAEDEAHVYNVTTAPLAEQIELAAAALAIVDAVASGESTYRLAA